jgi:hypothetical protein
MSNTYSNQQRKKVIQLIDIIDKLEKREHKISYILDSFELVDKVKEKLKRGTVHPHTGLVFWQYDRNKEYWVSPKEFEKKKHLMRLSSAKWRKDPQVNIALQLSSLLRARLLGKLKDSDSKMIKLVGVPLHEFKRYISTMFQEEMTWENRGIVWHLDHVKSYRNFNLETESGKKEYMFYTNLQPLLILDNLKKRG